MSNKTENLIFSLEILEAKGKREEIMHLIRHLKLKNSNYREANIDSGLLKILNGEDELNQQIANEKSDPESYPDLPVHLRTLDEDEKNK